MWDLRYEYWDHKKAKRGKWKLLDTMDDDEESPTLELIMKLGIDLEPWCHAFESSYDEELPETPPLPWVKEHQVVRELFPFLTDTDIRGYKDELALVVAYAIEALREDQPKEWEVWLYIADVIHYDLPTFEEIRDRLAARVATEPRAIEFAQRIAATSDCNRINLVLHDLYDSQGALRLWVIT